MKNTFYEKFDANNLWHERDAHSISYWSKKSESMLSVDSSVIEEHPYGILAQKAVQGVVGYVALKEFIHGGAIGQIGALIVHPDYQGNGVASFLVKNILKTAPSYFPDMEAGFAYANEDSTPLFLKYGGVIAGERRPLATTGCNNIIDLSGAMGLPGVEDTSLTDILNVNETRVS